MAGGSSLLFAFHVDAPSFADAGGDAAAPLLRRVAVVSAAMSSAPVSAAAFAGPQSGRFVVICLCAEWCGTCRDYRPGFEALAGQFADVDFRWLDIEDEADELGDLDVENFPTVFIRRGESILFYGTLLPHLSTLRRLIETFVEQTAEQSHDYARSTPERLAWQQDDDLRRLGRGV